MLPASGAGPQRALAARHGIVDPDRPGIVLCDSAPGPRVRQRAPPGTPPIAVGGGAAAGYGININTSRYVAPVNGTKMWLVAGGAGACMYTADQGGACAATAVATTQGLFGAQVFVAGGADTFIGLVPDGASVTATNTDGTPAPLSGQAAPSPSQATHACSRSRSTSQTVNPSRSQPQGSQPQQEGPEPRQPAAIHAAPNHAQRTLLAPRSGRGCCFARHTSRGPLRCACEPNSRPSRTAFSRSRWSAPTAFDSGANPWRSKTIRVRIPRRSTARPPPPARTAATSRPRRYSLNTRTTCGAFLAPIPSSHDPGPRAVGLREEQQGQGWLMARR